MIVIFIKVAKEAKATMSSGNTMVPMVRDGIAVMIPAKRVMTGAALPWAIVLHLMERLLGVNTAKITNIGPLGAQILDKLGDHTSH